MGRSSGMEQPAASSAPRMGRPLAKKGKAVNVQLRVLRCCVSVLCLFRAGEDVHVYIIFKYISCVHI